MDPVIVLVPVAGLLAIVTFGQFTRIHEIAKERDEAVGQVHGLLDAQRNLRKRAEAAEGRETKLATENRVLRQRAESAEAERDLALRNDHRDPSTGRFVKSS